MAKQIIENLRTRQRIDSIDTGQLEYTAGKLFEYGTLVVAVVAVYATVIYMGVQQLKK